MKKTTELELVEKQMQESLKREVKGLGDITIGQCTSFLLEAYRDYKTGR